mmetsp:Transcript_18485/g.60183  ORF Transcript_18485/g.60183 Transcript_18485/m.60183 type:complete len:262 (+) Transcript_18485:1063-1848(+)
MRSHTSPEKVSGYPNASLTMGRPLSLPSPTRCTCTPAVPRHPLTVSGRESSIELTNRCTTSPLALLLVLVLVLVFVLAPAAVPAVAVAVLVLVLAAVPAVASADAPGAGAAPPPPPPGAAAATAAPGEDAAPPAPPAPAATFRARAPPPPPDPTSAAVTTSPPGGAPPWMAFPEARRFLMLTSLEVQYLSPRNHGMVWRRLKVRSSWPASRLSCTLWLMPKRLRSLHVREPRTPFDKPSAAPRAERPPPALKLFDFFGTRK